MLVSDASIYFNECCWGGDVVRDRFLPLISSRYEDVSTHQEDWGWFIWFRQGPIHLAINIFCDDPKQGLFRIHLSATRRRFLWRRIDVDTPELGGLRDLVARELSDWAGNCQIEKIW